MFWKTKAIGLSGTCIWLVWSSFSHWTMYFSNALAVWSTTITTTRKTLTTSQKIMCILMEKSHAECSCDSFNGHNDSEAWQNDLVRFVTTATKWWRKRRRRAFLKKLQTMRMGFLTFISVLIFWRKNCGHSDWLCSGFMMLFFLYVDNKCMCVCVVVMNLWFPDALEYCVSFLPR